MVPYHYSYFIYDYQQNLEELLENSGWDYYTYCWKRRVRHQQATSWGRNALVLHRPRTLGVPESRR